MGKMLIPQAVYSIYIPMADLPGSEFSPIEPTDFEQDGPAPGFEVREMGIDDLAPVYHLGERLFTSDLYPSLYRTWEE
jgi:hypothetical protein